MQRISKISIYTLLFDAVGLKVNVFWNTTSTAYTYCLLKNNIEYACVCCTLCQKITDSGGSIIVHAFGAYFGLAVSFIMRPKQEQNNTGINEGSVYTSDIFAMVGTIFLWIFWPSFNSALLDDIAQQHRAILNTYLSLAAATGMFIDWFTIGIVVILDWIHFDEFVRRIFVMLWIIVFITCCLSLFINILPIPSDNKELIQFCNIRNSNNICCFGYCQSRS